MRGIVNKSKIFSCLFILLQIANGLKLRGIANEICVDQPNGAIVPHPNECAIYYTCNFNVAFEKQCEPGYWYDPQEKLCSLDVLNCSNFKDTTTNHLQDNTNSDEFQQDTTNNVDSIEIFTTTDGASTDGTFHGSWPAPNIPTTNAPLITSSTIFPDIEPNIQCPIDDTPVITYIASRLHCPKYYLCYHRRAVAFNCVSGYHWSPSKEECVLERDSECTIDKPVVYQKCPTSGQSFMPHPEACEYFLFCFNGIQSLQRCPAFYQWDSRNERCERLTLNKCMPRN